MDMPSSKVRYIFKKDGICFGEIICSDGEALCQGCATAEREAWHTLPKAHSGTTSHFSPDSISPRRL